ncbi:hypothetical protein Golomagni_04460 [Golovinomyces magnicellulatus]|nr:hypothetical protein Golomagni_04460 [Golovinomyces magnicellulatus]
MRDYAHRRTVSRSISDLTKSIYLYHLLCSASNSNVTDWLILDHQLLPPWRFWLRQKILSQIQLETPYLARMQSRMRSSVIDSYFAITANLGTHTFFMIILPILFWCGYTSLGRGMVHILATGVFLTGVLKDLLSLPRPLAPPLRRISMSESAALEYGFPSTHSANAVSVAVYVILTLHSPEYYMHQSKRQLVECIVYFYVFSIVFGRLYCGMHGFIDVTVGSAIGAAISIIEHVYGSRSDKFLYQSSWVAPASIAFAMVFLVILHPKPADECPCFDDTVAFAGVIIGIEIGGWRYANSKWAWDYPVPATVPFDLNEMGWVLVILRTLTGVLVIFMWRIFTKSFLLSFLPYLFNVIESYGLKFNQIFFKLALNCRSTLSIFKVGNVTTASSNRSRLDQTISHLSQERSSDENPQVPGNAHETSVGRLIRRREDLRYNDNCQQNLFCCSNQSNKNKTLATVQTYRRYSSAKLPGILESYSSQDQITSNLDTFTNGSVNNLKNSCFLGEATESKTSSGIHKPRLRCKIEITTKLIVYLGIGWLAVEINPIIFEIIGLGLGYHSYPNQQMN